MQHIRLHNVLRWFGHWPVALMHAVLIMLLVAPQAADAQPVSSDSPAGYIDPAVVQNQVRFRFDAAYGNPFPDRGEFFYPTCGCFPGAPGPPLPESEVDYQELEAYVELVIRPNWSAFVEIPVRFIDPVVNDNTAGLSDIRAGLRCALIEQPCQWLTGQLRVYTPTGDGRRGLGTEHASIEPALLFQRNAERSSWFGEFRAWIPISPNKEVFPPGEDSGGELRDYAGTILRYGLGTSFDVCQSGCQCHRRRTTLVTEFVGWTILDGLKERSLTPTEPVFDPDGNINPNFRDEYASARGDTIVNAKVGLRWSTPRDSIYVGYGRALTGDVWYENMLRAQYTIRF